MADKKEEKPPTETAESKEEKSATEPTDSKEEKSPTEQPESKQPAHKYKLAYFDAKGFAEPIRWILAYHEIPFEDYRIHNDDWATYVQGSKYISLKAFYGLKYDKAGMN